MYHSAGVVSSQVPELGLELATGTAEPVASAELELLLLELLLLELLLLELLLLELGLEEAMEPERALDIAHEEVLFVEVVWLLEDVV
jgi:hypothetical protein